MAYLARANKIQKYKFILIYTNYIYITGKFTINSHCYQRWKETVIISIIAYFYSTSL